MIGFRVKILHVDGEFESLRSALAELSTFLNTVSQDEHITQSTYNRLSSKELPTQMVVQMDDHSNFWLNMFPVTNSISGATSPWELTTGLCIDYKWCLCSARKA